MTNLILFGNSGAGKDTAANYLVNYLGYSRVHPLAEYKQFLESYYHLESGALDTPKGKATLVAPPQFDDFKAFMIRYFGGDGLRASMIYNRLDLIFNNSLVTLGDSMINMFHVNEHLMIDFTAPYMKRRLEDGTKKVFIAIRNWHEAKAIKAKGDYVVIKLTRPNHNGLSTDYLQNQLCDYLSNETKLINLENNGSIDEFQIKLHYAVNAIELISVHC